VTDRASTGADDAPTTGAAGAPASAPFEVLPAIDLREGRVVRLRQGDFARETAYSDDPVATAVAFADAGARWLHVVDLDGARLGTPRQFETIAAIVETVGGRLSVEIAGGLRSEGAVAAALAVGARRVVVGTAVLHDAQLAATLVTRHGADHIVVSLDVRAGRVAGHGWDPGADGDAVEAVLVRLADVGVRTFEVTAIERDGELSGPDIRLLQSLVTLDPGEIVASAGIRSVSDLRALRALGCRGAIVGRALYDGELRLEDALAALDGTAGE
jgi:phosphoribosylformimino-5-aminoimidazole carboxamide ribotide isomerase